MSLYHCHAGVVSRATGGSTISSYSYMSGQCLVDDRTGIVHDYSAKEDVVVSKTLAPENAPLWAKNGETLWQHAEAYEDHYADLRYRTEESRSNYKDHAQVAQSLIVGLQKELSDEQNMDAIEGFLNEAFVSRGLACSYAIHEDEGNPHAHIMVTRRAVGAEGFSWRKDRDIMTRSSLLMIRKEWANHVNKQFEKAGISDKVDHRSLSDRGLNFIPSLKEGYLAHSAKLHGLESTRNNANADIRRINKEIAVNNPLEVLKEVASTRSTFTEKDLAICTFKRVDGDEAAYTHVMTKLMTSPKVISVGVDIQGRERFTTEDHIHVENNLKAKSEVLQERAGHRLSSIDGLLAEKYSYLSPEQKQAVEHLANPGDLKCLVGRAGVGKTTLLRPIAEAAEAQGYRIKAMALSGVAAEGLGNDITRNDISCDARTLHSWMYAWKEGRDLLKAKDIVILDEAGMVGTEHMNTLVSHVEKAGAKLIAVGDPHQLQAIDAGSGFDLLLKVSPPVEVKANQRQKLDWMKEASRNFGDLKVREGLEAYSDRGHLHWEKDPIKALAQEYVKDFDAFRAQEKSLLALASTRVEVDTLNRQIREGLKEQGYLLEKGTVIHGQEWSENDRLVFLKNDRDLGVKNGTMGTVKTINDHTLTVSLDSKEQVTFSADEYKNIQHGYAVTTHKSQGATVDKAYGLLGSNQDAMLTHVMATRHRESLKLYADKDKDFDSLVRTLSRVSSRDQVNDYTVKDQDAWDRVTSYVDLTQKAAGLFGKIEENSIDIAPSAHKDWKQFQSLCAERKTLSKEILEEWPRHSKLVYQAHLSKEKLEVHAGLRERRLNPLEQKAKLTVEMYQEASKQAIIQRDLYFKELKNSMNQESVSSDKYEEARMEQKSLARVMAESPSLHRRFAKDYNVSWKAIEAQSKSIRDEPHGDKSLEKEEGKNPRNTVSRATGSFKPYKAFTNPDNALSHAAASSHLTFQDVSEKLGSRMEGLCEHLLGKPDSKTRTQWRYGNKGSLVVQVAGEKKGAFYDFERGEGGHAFQLIEREKDIKGIDALTWAASWLGESTHTISSSTASSTVAEKTWRPVFPIPHGHPKPDIAKDPYLNYMLEGRHETARYTYKDQQGRALGYVVRLEDKDGNKVTPVLTLCENDKGQRHWKWSGFGDVRPLYGLDRLVDSQKPVLIVEGEKAADAAHKMFGKDYAVVTWPGGVNSVGKADWTDIKGRDVTLWPDNDAAGKGAMEVLKGVLEIHGIKSTHTVTLPECTPHKWDLGDPLPQGWRTSDLKDLIQESKPISPKNHKGEVGGIAERVMELSERQENTKTYEEKNFCQQRLDQIANKTSEDKILMLRLGLDHPDAHTKIEKLVDAQKNQQMSRGFER